jgi:hypothetical protein
MNILFNMAGGVMAKARKRPPVRSKFPGGVPRQWHTDPEVITTVTRIPDPSDPSRELLNLALTRRGRKGRACFLFSDEASLRKFSADVALVLKEIARLTYAEPIVYPKIDSVPLSSDVLSDDDIPF